LKLGSLKYQIFILCQGHKVLIPNDYKACPQVSLVSDLCGNKKGCC